MPVESSEESPPPDNYAVAWHKLLLVGTIFMALDNETHHLLTHHIYTELIIRLSTRVYCSRASVYPTLANYACESSF